MARDATMSHFTMFEVPTYHKIMVPVDGGMVTYPTLEQKKDIINNTVETLVSMGYTCPKVGVLACVEKLNPKMPETVEANELKEMNKRGEIKNCIVEGPISYDCAVSKEIADFKGFDSPVAGDVDIPRHPISMPEISWARCWPAHVMRGWPVSSWELSAQSCSLQEEVQHKKSIYPSLYLLRQQINWRALSWKSY